MEPSIILENGSPTITSSTEATLSGSFSAASSVPVEIGFYWGTSSNSMPNKVSASVVTAKEGSFSADIKGLKPGETYVYQAYAVVRGTGNFSEQEQVFYAPDTRYFQMQGGSAPSVDKDWLELPSGAEGSRYIVNTTYAGERNYTHLYDTEMMTSLWTAYPLKSEHMGSLSRPGSWSFNPAIPQSSQPDLCSHSYNNATYSRGHMCPNGSRNGNATMQKQTFYVTNQVPQIQNNFNSGIWSNLENAVQGLVSGNSEEVYVVTGVAFNKVGENRTVNYVSPKDDSKQCPIPNYFYKIVLRVKYSGSAVVDAETIGFWFEHKTYSKDSYVNYTVSVNQIEEWTGFDYFVNLPDSVENRVESTNPSWSEFSAW